MTITMSSEETPCVDHPLRLYWIASLCCPLAINSIGKGMPLGLSAPSFIYTPNRIVLVPP